MIQCSGTFLFAEQKRNDPFYWQQHGSTKQIRFVCHGSAFSLFRVADVLSPTRFCCPRFYYCEANDNIHAFVGFFIVSLAFEQRLCLQPVEQCYAIAATRFQFWAHNHHHHHGAVGSTISTPMEFESTRRVVAFWIGSQRRSLEWARRTGALVCSFARSFFVCSLVTLIVGSMSCFSRARSISSNQPSSSFIFYSESLSLSSH